MTDIEQCAAEICARILDGRAEPRDVHGGSGLHDYDIVLPGGTIALEVTRSTLPEERAHAEANIARSFRLDPVSDPLVEQAAPTRTRI